MMQSHLDIDSSLPTTGIPGRSVTLELDDKEWIYQVLTVGYYLSPYGDKLGLLLGKCNITVITVKHIRHRATDFEFRSDLWNSTFDHRKSVGAL